MKVFERERLMIKNVVFILGAGASCPYGFPTASELREQILSNYVSDWHSYLIPRQKVGANIPEETEKALRFVEIFRKSSNESIDLFLARNPEFSKVGKRAIIFRILAAEHASGFREKTKHANQDWYIWLYKQMMDKLKQKKIIVVSVRMKMSRLSHLITIGLWNIFCMIALSILSTVSLRRRLSSS